MKRRLLILRWRINYWRWKRAGAPLTILDDEADSCHPFDPRCVCLACGEQIRKARAWESPIGRTTKASPPEERDEEADS